MSNASPIDPRSLDMFFKKAELCINEHIKDALSTLAQECDNRIRERGADESWRDVSGNLRSSIGAAVYERGAVIFSTAFVTIKNGTEGSNKGRRMIQELASQYANTIALMVIAAMPYAETLEAIQSKDVLESTRLWAEKEVEKKLKAAVGEATEEINTWQL